MKQVIWTFLTIFVTCCWWAADRWSTFDSGGWYIPACLGTLFWIICVIMYCVEHWED